jgi:hypothetical protein
MTGLHEVKLGIIRLYIIKKINLLTILKKNKTNERDQEHWVSEV